MLVVIDVKCLMEVFDNAQLSAWRSGCIIDGTIMPWSLGVVVRTKVVKDLISPWSTLMIGATELTCLKLGNLLSLIFGWCVNIMPWSLSVVRWGRTTMVKDLISSWPTLVIGAIELTSLDVGNFLSLIFGCCVSLVTHCSGGPHNGGERLDKPLVHWTLWSAELLSSRA